MKIKTILLYLLVIFLILCGCVFGAYQYFFGNLTHDDSFNTDITNAVDRLAVNTYDTLEQTDIKNIAIFGIDSESSDQGRSDASMILSIDYVHNKIKLCSIARDTLVYIPDKDVYEKFTHAYAYGGAELAVKTLNTNFNLDITDYIAVNFSEMADIVDMLGGVQVDLTQDEIDYMGVNGKSLSPGSDVMLDGTQAVAYSRIRYLDNDNVRTSRQRKVLSSIFSKARSMSATQYPGLIRQGLGMCTTSLSYTEILKYSQILLKEDLSLEQDALPGDHVESWGGIMPSSGAWCYIYDLHNASDYLFSFIYEDLYANSDVVIPKATVDASFIP